MKSEIFVGSARFTPKISDEFASAVPGYRALVVEADVVNDETPDALWQQIIETSHRVAASYAMDMVNKHPAIAATRKAYKACGKDPNRYRPSSEALMRRMVKGLELYRTLAVIDLINLLSVATGHSIGGFDADKVDGNVITLGVGREGEPYQAIGRGELNIAGLPVWRDNIGGIGTPTSDNDRTKLTPDTMHLLMIVNIFDPADNAEDIAKAAASLIEKYANGQITAASLWTY